MVHDMPVPHPQHCIVQMFELKQDPKNSYKNMTRTFPPEPNPQAGGPGDCRCVRIFPILPNYSKLTGNLTIIWHTNSPTISDPAELYQDTNKSYNNMTQRFPNPQGDGPGNFRSGESHTQIVISDIWRIHTYIYTYIHTCIHLYVYMYTYIHIYLHASINPSINASIYQSLVSVDMSLCFKFLSTQISTALDLSHRW